ncbi:MAG TPA: hypothetical protein VEH04_16885 [Verrucomicrobiae bacterium]|nr:hypothetical protein [Verrucomicrobiae bacterium]
MMADVSDIFLRPSVLDRIRKRFIVHLPESLRHTSTDVESYIDHMARTVAVSFEMWVLGENLAPVVVERVPTTWWQHLKKAHAPEWFLKRWPVTTRDVVALSTAIYPELKFQVPPDQSRVQVYLNPLKGLKI